MLMFIDFIISPSSIVIYGLLFAVAGAYIVAEIHLKVGPYPDRRYGATPVTWLCILDSVNGVGDLISNLVVDGLWSVYGFAAGFTFTTILGALESLL